MVIKVSEDDVCLPAHPSACCYWVPVTFPGFWSPRGEELFILEEEEEGGKKQLSPGFCILAGSVSSKGHRDFLPFSSASMKNRVSLIRALSSTLNGTGTQEGRTWTPMAVQVTLHPAQTNLHVDV